MSMMKTIDFCFGQEPAVVQIPKPVPGADEVLIKVETAALDTALHEVIGKGPFAAYLHSTKTNPLLLGWHYAGTIEAVGSDADDWQVGDEVFGHLQYSGKTSQGSVAEFITVASDECGKKPANVSFDTAAASATETMTALQAIRDEGKLVEGKSVLIFGSAGGVGSAAVQIAKALGASMVTAVCSTRDVRRVQMYGADVVIDRRKNNPESLVEGPFDVIFDATGLYRSNRWTKKLSKGGRYVSTLPNWGVMWGFLRTLFTSKGIRMVHATSKRSDLELVGKWLDSGEVVIDVDSNFKAIHMKDAMKRQANGSKNGRVVVTVSHGWR